MSTLRIKLFGKFHCEVDNTPLSGLELHKVQELFGYLALFRTRLHHRDVLATLLWDDRSELHAKKALRQTLWLLQSALNNGTTGSDRSFLTVEDDWIGLNPRADIWVDTQVLETAYQHVRQASGPPLGDAEAQSLREVVSLYEGDLLEGWFCDWCIQERERHQFLFLSILDTLLGFCETRADYKSGVYYGSLILRYDNARESTHRRLMYFHYIMGHRTRALRQYETCVTVLAKELGVPPAKRTQTLYEQICRDQLEGIQGPLPAAEHAAALPAAAMPFALSAVTLLTQLTVIRQMIEQLQQQVDGLVNRRL